MFTSRSAPGSQPVEHLAQVGSGRRMHQGDMILPRMVSTMPSTVMGLTKQDAVDRRYRRAAPGRPTRPRSVTGRTCPPGHGDRLPSRAVAAGDGPAATTVPAPSLPVAIGLPTRPAAALMAASGSGAVTTGRSAEPPATAAVTSAPARSRPMSDGLIGDASTRTITSPGPGSGTGTVSRDSSTVWSALTSDCSCKVVTVFSRHRSSPSLVWRGWPWADASRDAPRCADRG